MARRKRRNHNAKFKAKVALEAVKGTRTIGQIADEFELHSNQVTSWKKQLCEGIESIFESPGTKPEEPEHCEDVEALQAKVGQLTMELDWLKKKIEKLATLRERVAAVDRRSPGRLTVTRQCELLSISRATFYYQPASETPENLTLMREIDQIHLDYPFLGTRRMTKTLNRADHRPHPVNRKRVKRLMRKMGISTVYPKPNTSLPDHSHKIYPYLLRDRAIERPNEVWCATSLTSRWNEGSCTWWQSWTGIPGLSWPGNCPTRWKLTSV